MWLWAGLGNPGSRYQNNRHNVGFMTVDKIALRYHFPKWRKAFNAEVTEGIIAGEKVLLLKPQTYMNDSGLAIIQALKFYKLTSKTLMVFQDEMDLPIGKARIKWGGGHAGNNGIRSIISHVGDDFGRFRIGVDKPAQSADRANYVLNDFSKEQWQIVEDQLEYIASLSEFLVKGQDSQMQSALTIAMEKYTKDQGE